MVKDKKDEHNCMFLQFQGKNKQKETAHFTRCYSCLFLWLLGNFPEMMNDDVAPD